MANPRNLNAGLPSGGRSVSRLITRREITDATGISSADIGEALCKVKSKVSQSGANVYEREPAIIATREWAAAKRDKFMEKVKKYQAFIERLDNI